jgi:cellulose synthase/poly-beta-1,6-N-acetylglucosamine synthase-like glycosyltransferase
MGVEITAAVCSFNRAELLRRCIESLLAQDFEGEYQVIVIDNGSWDHTQQVVEELSRTAPSNVLFEHVRHEQNRGLGAARNTALERAVGGIIAYTDDDTVVDTDWVRNIAKCFREHPEIVAAGGPVRNGHVNNVVAEIGQHIVTARLYAGVVDGYCTFLIGNNQAYRKEAIEKVGGFEENLVLGGEEAEIQSRLLETGGRMMFSPDIVVTHYQRSTLRSFIRQYYRYGVSLYTTRSKYEASGRTNNYLAQREPVPVRVKRMLLLPFRVVPHVQGAASKLLAIPVVYLGVCVRGLGYIVAKLGARVRIPQVLLPRA